MLTFGVGTVAAIALLFFIGLGTVVIPCAKAGPSGFGCEEIYTVWLPVWSVLFAISFSAVAFIASAWWAWFGVRRT